MNDQSPESLGHALISEVLWRRRDPGSSAWCATVRKAIAPATELAAYGHTERLLVSVHGTAAKTGVRRAAAVCACTPATQQASAPKGKNLPTLGRSLALLRTKASAQSINTRVNVLPMMDLENAASTLHGLIQQCGNHGISINFYDLAHTLARWGNGLSPSSQQVRQRLISTYYAADLEDVPAS